MSQTVASSTPESDMDEYLFIDRDDTSRMYLSPYVELDPERTDPHVMAVETAWRKSVVNANLAADDTSVTVKKAIGGVSYFVTIYSGKRPVQHLLAVYRSLPL